ncbi:MAG TPA: sugar phosphate isomerase/epimerase [Chitinophagaceae bacterium]|nr:sugar phosphate isomerase/epimerase [Chitinophagaceae bacterium]
MSLQVKFGASTWLWTSPFKTESIEEIFSKISSMGFDVVEIAVEDPSIIDVDQVAASLDKYKLGVVICGAFGPSRDLTHEDESVHQNCFDYIEQCFKICKALGAKFLAGPMYSAVGKARMVPAEQRKKEWALAVKNIRRVCEMAASFDLMIGLEPLNRFESDLVNNVDDVLRMINDVGHPAAGIVLDGFHMNIEEPDIVQAITKAGDKLIHMQVSENYRGTPGTGQTKWEDYRKGLELINYKGVVSIESFTPENQELAGAVCFWHPMAESQDGFASEGLRFLKNWAK